MEVWFIARVKWWVCDDFVDSIGCRVWWFWALFSSCFFVIHRFVDGLSFDCMHASATMIFLFCFVLFCSHINSHKSSPWSQDRLQSLWSWGIPPGKKHKQIKGGARIYHSWRNSCLRQKHIKSGIGSQATMCQIHTGAIQLYQHYYSIIGPLLTLLAPHSQHGDKTLGTRTAKFKELEMG